MALADLLQWIFHSQKTGTLIVHSVFVEKRLFFKEGIIIATASNDPREYLGHFLVSYGYITEEELRKAMEVQQETQMLLGKILVMIDAIKPEELQKLLRLKAEESIYEMFLWEDGEFTFVENLLPEIKMVPLNLNPTNIIMEGLRRTDEWARIREVFRNTRAVPSLREGVSKLPEKYAFLQPHIDGKRTIQEIAFLTRHREFDIAKICYNLYQKGILSITPGEEEEKKVALIDVDEGELEVQYLLTQSAMAFKKGELPQAWELARSAQTMDPDNLTIKDKVERLQTAIIHQAEKEGIELQAVPQIAKKDLSNIKDLSPKMGFVLSRINGQWTIQNILSVLPIHVVDAYLVFHELLKKGIITMKK